jgi:asparagine synthase (glutamine-hydrolysing)
MRDVLRHRGPDAKGLYFDAGIALGHCRLSIVDVAAGHQPMTNEDGSLHITYNGEIYNHTDFRSGLEAKGHVYRSKCDTETILHLYEEHGQRCVEYLRGMFAFAIWDERSQELFIARDRLGVKPLYYSLLDDGSLYFGSEIKALFEAGAIKPEINFSALPDYLANRAPSGEETLFCGVRRLLPGHTLLWKDGNVKLSRYWDVSFAEIDNTRSDTDYIAEWTDLFRTSVRLRLMADVPLGMFLSGGIDSSAIAATMSGMVDEPIKTFSVAFAEREANELEYARIVAKVFKTDHHEIIVSPDEFFNSLPELIWHEDEPLAHAASVPLYFVSRLASEHVKVVLTGEGSDELLAGYGRYGKTILNQSLGSHYEKFVPLFVQDGIRQGISRMSSESTMRQKLSRTFLSRSSDIESIYFDNFAVFPRSIQPNLLSPATQERIGTSDPYKQVRDAFNQMKDASLLDRLLFADIKTYLPELLMKQDQMSMAASIESRVPFLDHELVEFTCRLPRRMKLRRGMTKYILRESMNGLLPEAIISRPKMGFPVPLASWFRRAYRWVIDEYVLSQRALDRGVFSADFVCDIAQRHMSGQQDHSERLWTLLNFEIWQRQIFEGDGKIQKCSKIEFSHVI